MPVAKVERGELNVRSGAVGTSRVRYLLVSVIAILGVALTPIVASAAPNSGATTEKGKSDVRPPVSKPVGPPECVADRPPFDTPVGPPVSPAAGPPVGPPVSRPVGPPLDTPPPGPADCGRASPPVSPPVKKGAIFGGFVENLGGPVGIAGTVLLAIAAMLLTAHGAATTITDSPYRRRIKGRHRR